MVRKQKKAYMKRYNKQPAVKAKKKEYMRKIRARKDKEAAYRLVRFLLDMNYEDLAYQHAQERAPEMLLTVKAKARPKRR